MSYKIVITDCSWGNTEIERSFLPSDAIIEEFQITTEDELIEKCKDADAILSEYAPLSERVLGELKNLKVISNTAIGVDNIDLAAAKKFGIAICNVPGYCAYEVADHTMALMLACLRNIVFYERKVRQEIWDINNAPTMKRISELKLGLLGFGKIPQMVAKRAQGFDMEVVAYDPFVSESVFAEKNVTQVASIREIMETCDVISCHLPLTSQTVGILDWEMFSAAKKTPVFINTSRGKVIDEDALVKAIKLGKIKCAGLDVLQCEPADFHAEIFSLDQVVLTPHAAFYSETALREVRMRSAKNVTNFLSQTKEQIDYVYCPTTKA